MEIMKTGKYGYIEIEDRTKGDDEILISIDDDADRYSSAWISKDHAINIIKHLSSEFKINLNII